MKAKKAVLPSLSLPAVLTCAADAVADQQLQYHMPVSVVKPRLVNERYQLAGMAVNFDFDIAVIGNFIAERFRASDCEKGMGKNGKACIL